jgi:hypothetical protein
MRVRMNPRELLFWIVIILLNCSGLILLHTYPFTDLPNHLAAATVFKYRSDLASPLLSAYTSTVTWYQPTVAHIVLCSFFPSVESGNAILLLLYVVSVPAVVALIARKCGGSSFVASLSVLTLWNFDMMWGFAGYTLAIPLVLLSIYLHLGGRDRQPGLQLAALGVVFLLLYWFHVLAFLFAALCYACMEVYRAFAMRSVSRILLRFTPLLPSGVLLILWIVAGREFQSSSTLGFLKEYYSTHYTLAEPVRRAWQLFTLDGQAIAAGWVGMLAALLISSSLFIPAVVCVMRYRGHAFRPSPAQISTLMFTVVALLCFFLLPNELPGQNYLYQRFSVFVLLGIVCVLSWALPALWSDLPRYVIPSVVALYSILWCQYFISFSALSAEFVSFFPREKELWGKTMGAIICEPDFRGRRCLVHYNNYQIIWNRGITPTMMVQYRFGAIRRSARELPEYDDWVDVRLRLGAGMQSILFAKAFDQYSTCEYLMTRGENAYSALKERPEFEIVRRVNSWTLAKRMTSDADSGRSAPGRVPEPPQGTPPG